MHQGAILEECTEGDLIARSFIGIRAVWWGRAGDRSGEGRRSLWEGIDPNGNDIPCCVGGRGPSCILIVCGVSICVQITIWIIWNRQGAIVAVLFRSTVLFVAYRHAKIIPFGCWKVRKVSEQNEIPGLVTRKWTISGSFPLGTTKAVRSVHLGYEANARVFTSSAASLWINPLSWTFRE